MAETAAVNPDDPASWPDDLEALEKMALESGEDSEQVAVDPPQAAADADDSATGGDTPEGEKADAEGEKTASEEEGKASGGAEGDAEADGVLTKDGKRVIPFSVLAGTRSDLEQSRARVQELEGSNATLQQQLAAGAKAAIQEGAKADAAGDAAAGGESDPVQAQIEALQALKEEEADDKAMQVLIDGQIAALQENQALRKESREMHKRFERQDQDSEQSKLAEIQEAMDNAPLLTAWASDTQDRTYHEHATSLHAHLMEHDPGYASKTWAERFAALPGKVEALYGESSQGKALREQQSRAGDTAAKPGNGKVQEKVPTSLSDLPAGAGGDGGGSDVAQFSTMSGREMMAKMQQMAESGRLEDWLSGVS